MSDLAFEISSDYIENSEIFTQEKVVMVLVENLMDGEMWNDVLPVLENFKFEYSTILDVADELNLKKAEGCTQLEKINNYHLGKYLIICKDSDYSYIVFLMNNIIKGSNSGANYTLSDYIFETIVHSKESISLYLDYILSQFANRLNVHRSLIEERAKWIGEFYRNFSKLIYSVLLKTIYHDYILFFKVNVNKLGFQKIFNILRQLKCIKINNMNDCEIFFNSKIWRRVHSELMSFENGIDKIFLSNNEKDNVDLILSKIGTYGIVPENIYNFFRGHDLQNIFEHILERYYNVIYDYEINVKCRDLEANDSKIRRKQLEKSKKALDFSSQNRALAEHLFFSETYARLNELYTKS